MPTIIHQIIVKFIWHHAPKNYGTNYYGILNSFVKNDVSLLNHKGHKGHKGKKEEKKKFYIGLRSERYKKYELDISRCP
jgi:hypothetical protein